MQAGPLTPFTGGSQFWNVYTRAGHFKTDPVPISTVSQALKAQFFQLTREITAEHIQMIIQSLCRVEGAQISKQAFAEFLNGFGDVPSSITMARNGFFVKYNGYLAPWYHHVVTDDECMSRLRQANKEGGYLVRKSNTDSRTFALYYYTQGTAHKTRILFNFNAQSPEQSRYEIKTQSATLQGSTMQDLLDHPSLCNTLLKEPVSPPLTPDQTRFLFEQCNAFVQSHQFVSRSKDELKQFYKKSEPPELKSIEEQFKNCVAHYDQIPQLPSTHRIPRIIEIRNHFEMYCVEPINKLIANKAQHVKPQHDVYSCFQAGNDSQKIKEAQPRHNAYDHFQP